MFVLVVDLSLHRQQTTLEEKLAFGASLNHSEKCLGMRNLCSTRESKHRLKVRALPTKKQKKTLALRAFQMHGAHGHVPSACECIKNRALGAWKCPRRMAMC